MVKLITRNNRIFGQRNIVPYAGEVQISETGEIEVESEEIANSLVAANCGWELPVEDSTTTTTSSTTTTTTEAPSSTTTTTTTQIADQVNKDTLSGHGDDADPYADKSEEWKALNAQSKAELQEMLKKAEKPGAEWRSLNKEDLIDYILQNV